MGLSYLTEDGRKNVEQSFKKSCITNALNGTKDDLLQDNSDFDCCDLDLECETGRTSEEDSEQINLI
jgi:hypothetical protein